MLCDRDKRQKNLMVIFNRSCCKIEDDLGIWCRGIQLEIRKNDKGTLHLGCGQLSRKNVPPSARAENCHLLKKVDENFMITLPRERKGAGLRLTDNANRVQAQPALISREIFPNRHSSFPLCSQKMHRPFPKCLYFFPVLI